MTTTVELPETAEPAADPTDAPHYATFTLSSGVVGFALATIVETGAIKAFGATTGLGDYAGTICLGGMIAFVVATVLATRLLDHHSARATMLAPVLYLLTGVATMFLVILGLMLMVAASLSNMQF